MNQHLRRLLFRSAILALAPSLLAAQGSATVRGKITSGTGAPLAEASVFIPSLNLGTTTGQSGDYSFVVPSVRIATGPVTLTARRIGYAAKSVEIQLTPGTTVTRDLVLGDNPLRLGEVVITGAGTATEVEKLATSINSVKGEDIVRSNETNIVNALAGKAPNVAITSQSGEPGASAGIRIRGLKTIVGTGQPLFVVDGTPIDNSTNATGSQLAGTVAPNRASDINPDDIESVEILKGAAAGAIYGARAGQGVILITTKKGAPGATRYTLRSQGSIDNVVKTYPLQRKYGQGNTNSAGAWISTICTTPGCFVGSTSAASSYGPALAGTSYDHYSELFETGKQLENELSISGGNDRTLFFLSGSESDNSGVIVGPNDAFHRYTTRVNASHRITDGLKVGANVSYVDTRGNAVQKGSNTSGLLLGGFRTPPDFNNYPLLDPVTHQQRSFRYPNPTPLSATTSRGYDNPLFVIFNQSNTLNSNRAFGNITADWTPLNWLTLKNTFGADYSGESRLQAIPKSSSTFPTGQVISFQFNNTQVDDNLIGTATYSLNRHVNGTFSLGTNFNMRRLQQEFVQGNTLLADSPFKLTNTLQFVAPTSDAEVRVNTNGYFGQATFDLFDQLYITGAARNDGSSTFSDNSRRNWFPSARAAWTFTDHLSKLHLDRIVSFGKARVAYGEVGQEPGAYQLLSLLVAGGSFGDGGFGPAATANQNGIAGLFTSGTKGQPFIKPERTKETEAGIDFGLFNSRVDGGVTWYQDYSTDVIFNVPLPPSTGYTSQVQNAGRIRNSGWEATLNYRPIQRRNFSWEIGGQWSTNDNKVLSLRGTTNVAQGGSFAGAFGAATVGGRVGGLRGNDFARCGAVDVAPSGGTAVLAAFNAACAGAAKGALYIDASGFPVVDNTERQIMDAQPKYMAGLTNRFRFGKLQLSSLLDFKKGGQVWNGTKGALYFFGTHFDTQDLREHSVVYGKTYMPQPNGVVGPGAGTSVFLVSQPGTTPTFNWFQGQGGGFGSVSAQFIEDGSYAKLREISLQYTWDAAFVHRRLGLSAVDIRLAGRNLKTWSHYTGFDPETNLGGAENALVGVDFFNNPQTRSFVLSLTLNR